MTCSVRLNDAGTEFRITIVDCSGNAVDISGATTKQLIFQKPDNTSLTKTASFYTNGTDGKISYVSESGVLDQTGMWKVQANIVAPNGTWSSTIKTFKVQSNLPLS